ncbi:hypothetical protein HAX54_000401, partial [Datura stramonium]|nr:hypothetical protein [Datura stramonium]
VAPVNHRPSLEERRLRHRPAAQLSLAGLCWHFANVTPVRSTGLSLQKLDLRLTPSKRTFQIFMINFKFKIGSLSQFPWILIFL